MSMRPRILEALADGEARARDIAQMIGESERSVSMTLGKMGVARLVERVAPHGHKKAAYWRLPNSSETREMEWLAGQRRTLVGRFLSSPAGARL